MTRATKRLDVESVRKDFPVLSTETNGKPLIFLDSAASAQKPNAVIDAIADRLGPDPILELFGWQPGV